jgi:flagellar hook protein FlgE
VVKKSNSDETYYTRDGGFTLDSSGHLVTSGGLRVQGWEAETTSTGKVRTVGSPKDIVIEDFQSPPKETSAVSMIVNVDSSATDGSIDTADPFFALFKQYDGTATSPLADDRYAYQTSIKTYDENGTAHDLTFSFDPVQDSNVTANADGSQIWEFTISVDPSTDGRVIDGQSLKDSEAAGLLMTGTLTFDSAGNLTGISAYTLKSDATGDLKDLSNWTAADFDSSGQPILTANFSGEANADGTDEAGARTIAIDFGASDRTSTPAWAGTATSADLAGNDPANLLNFATLKKSASSSTAFDQGSSTTNKSQDGYAAGFYQSLSVSSDGVVTGHYSNGQTMALYVLTMADFNNPAALNQEGGNLYSATTDSGSAITGQPGSGTLGDVSSNSLEQSNVDMSTEMVNLITAQRMYQANSKVITTADQLLQYAIGLVR